MSAADALGSTYGLVQPNRITEGITKLQIKSVLADAAKEASLLAAQLDGRTSVSAVVRREQLLGLHKGLGAVQTQLWANVGRITQAGMYHNAYLAVDQTLDLDLLTGIPGFAVMQYAPAMRLNAAHGVESLISRRTGGFTLADRIYANGKVGVKQVEKIVERSLALQESAKQLAARVKGFYNPDVPGGQSYAAMRLARTEINNAHHETTIRLGKEKPWVLGFKWNLSGSHKTACVCEKYASDNEGVYSKEDVPSKPHPHCLCWLTHVMEDDDVLIDRLAAGKYDDFMTQNGVKC